MHCHGRRPLGAGDDADVLEEHCLPVALPGEGVEGEEEATEETPEIVESEGPDVTITSLADRAADDKEDMDERNEWQSKVDALEEADGEVEDETTADVEESEIAEVEDEE